MFYCDPFGTLTNNSLRAGPWNLKKIMISETICNICGTPTIVDLKKFDVISSPTCDTSSAPKIVDLRTYFENRKFYEHE